MVCNGPFPSIPPRSTNTPKHTQHTHTRNTHTQTNIHQHTKRHQHTHNTHPHTQHTPTHTTHHKPTYTNTPKKTPTHTTHTTNTNTHQHTPTPLGSARKSRRLVALCLVPLFANRRTSSRLVRCVTVACAPNAFYRQPFASVGALLVPWHVGSANGSHFGYLWMIPSKRLMSRTGSSRLLPILPFPKVSWTLFLKLLDLRCLYHRYHGVRRKTRIYRGTNTSIAAATYMWAFGITLLLWCYFVWLRGSCLISIWSIHHVVKDEPPRNFGWTRVWHLESCGRFLWRFWENSGFIFSSIPASTNSSPSQSPMQKRLSAYKLEPWAPTR